MDKKGMFKLVRKLPFDKKKVVFKSRDTEIYLLRPSVLSKRFKDYDAKKNFQIWLREGGREFRPNVLETYMSVNRA